jgi:anti-sigma B factor antagonist
MGLTSGRRARLDVSRSATGLVVGLVGELDLASLPEVSPAVQELLALDRQPVVLDLGGLEFLDSTGVTVLVRIANHFEQVRTPHATAPVRRVIQVLGLAGRFGLDEA